MRGHYADGQAHARICEVNPLLTEEAHQAIEDLKNFPRSPYTDKATWWYIVRAYTYEALEQESRNVPLSRSPSGKVGERLDTLIRLAHEGARIVIKKDGIAQAYIQPANPNMSEDMYEALLALRSIPVAPNFDSEQMRAWMEEDRR